jgi:hypothetical protein
MQEVSQVAALENVLMVLEDARDRVHALELMGADLPRFIDRPTHNRYVEMLQGDGASSMGAFPEDGKFYYPR